MRGQPKPFPAATLPAALLATALALLLGGCAGAEPGTQVEKVKVAYAKLGAKPDTTYFQTVLDTDPSSAEVRTFKIALVPSADGKSFQIVDSEGEIFADYYDFLRNNTLTRR
jgi:PBP1b-binding outer membrane lipoprotein LpoB